MCQVVLLVVCCDEKTEGFALHGRLEQRGYMCKCMCGWVGRWRFIGGKGYSNRKDCSYQARGHMQTLVEDVTNLCCVLCVVRLGRLLQTFHGRSS